VAHWHETAMTNILTTVNIFHRINVIFFVDEYNMLSDAEGNMNKTAT
jgi:hypothetical protein